MEEVILFDLFGTLASCSQSLFVDKGKRVWGLLRQHGYHIDLDDLKRNWNEYFEQMEATSYVDCVEFHLFDFVNAFLQKNFPFKLPTFDFIKLVTETLISEWNQSVVFFDESKQVIDRLLADHRLGLISNTHYPKLIYGNLAKANLDSAFDVIVTSVEFGIKKPGRRIFKHAASKLRVDTRNCIYVGDDLKEDYEGAIGAGMNALLLDRNGEYQNFSGNRISRLTELASR